jgi:very-short-patch-repair endonuclease
MSHQDRHIRGILGDSGPAGATPHDSPISSSTDSAVASHVSVDAAAGAASGPTIEAAKTWADTLIDRTARNELLYCKDRGKIHLDDAVPAAVARLLRGDAVRLRKLFPEETAYLAAAKAAASIARRIKEYDEERGVRIGHLVVGFASWTDASPGRDRDRGRWGLPQRAAGIELVTPAGDPIGTDAEPVPSARREIRAPVLLRDVAVRRRAGREDFDLVADRDVEISPVLLHYVRSTFHIDVDPEFVADLNDIVDDPDRVDEALAKLGGALTDVPDFRIAPGALIGTFHYAKLAMHQDLMDNAVRFAGNDLVAAMAGDLGAIERIRRPIGDVTIDQPDRTPVADEFLVLDADPSQNYVVNAVLAGRTIVVQGPPGTGKSQTISNLIVTLAARGRTALFVAEKRAAIDAVLGRLTEAGLSGLTLDLHVSTANRGRVYEQFRSTIDGARMVEAIDHTRLHARLERDRAGLLTHAAAMHRIRPPWGLSVDTLQRDLLSVPAAARPDVRLAPGAVDMLDGRRADEVRAALAEYVAVGGLTPVETRGPWDRAQFRTDAEATSARDAVDQARIWESELMRRSAGVAASLSLDPPPTPAAAIAFVRLCARTDAVAARWHPEIYECDLRRMIAAASGLAAPAGGPPLGWWERIRLRRQARRRRVGSRRGNLAVELSEVAAVAHEWARAAEVRPPAMPAIAGAVSAGEAMEAALRELGPLVDSGQEWSVSARTLDDLSRSPNAAHVAARQNRLAADVIAAGAGELLGWLGRTAPTWAADRRSSLAVSAFDDLWRRAVLDRVVLADAHLASFDGVAHSAVADDFIATDHAHTVDNRQRVRRAVAERLTGIRTDHVEQDVYLSRELSRKRRLKPLRELVRTAPDVLLAAKPCWAMSPLLVSQLLPPELMFDVVIFDEASQVQPAEAIPSLARARAAVIAGDSMQLPPTTFFETAVDLDDEVDRDLLTQDAESVLDAFQRALGSTLAHEYYLGWHYRSRDARLIAPSNTFFYNNRMVTFPGTAVEPPIEFIQVEAAESRDGSSPQEVRRVVDLMIGHARRRPTESLGVITMGITHAIRIEDALRQRLRTEPDVRDWFDADAAEPCFVKNLERVQGDERDAIILAIGYGKSGGRMMHRFGPLNNAGGERRLNVAITRAKRRMTVVAGFHPDDLDPTRLAAEGAKRLADYLRYAAGGPVPASAVRDVPAADPFEIQVRDRLRALGIQAETKVGVTGSFIDVAVRHPRKSGRYVLAIEADGPSYYAAPTTRSRDRLRPEQLERLGWRFHRIWSTDWYRHPDREIARIRAAYEQAVYAADQADRAAARAAAAQPDGLTDRAGWADDAPIHPDAGMNVPGTLPGLAPGDRPDRATPPGIRRGPRPPASFGAPIGDYTDDELESIVAWIASDGLLRTDLELKREARDELGFRRNGARIEQRLSDAVAQVRVRRSAS